MQLAPITGRSLANLQLALLCHTVFMQISSSVHFDKFTTYLMHIEDTKNGKKSFSAEMSVSTFYLSTLDIILEGGRV